MINNIRWNILNIEQEGLESLPYIVLDLPLTLKFVVEYIFHSDSHYFHFMSTNITSQ